MPIDITFLIFIFSANAVVTDQLGEAEPYSELEIAPTFYYLSPVSPS